MIVPRTCTEISAGNENQHRKKEPRPLEEFQDVSAYVLLGDPGAGKTTAFKTERKKLREESLPDYSPRLSDFQPPEPSRMARQDALYRRIG